MPDMKQRKGGLEGTEHFFDSAVFGVAETS